MSEEELSPRGRRIVAALKEFADDLEAGVPIESKEVHSIVDSATHASDVDAARELADRIAARLSDREHPDSAGLIREVRDR
jgi:hypothetical protein